MSADGGLLVARSLPSLQCRADMLGSLVRLGMRITYLIVLLPGFEPGSTPLMIAWCSTGLSYSSLDPGNLKARTPPGARVAGGVTRPYWQRAKGKRKHASR